MFSLVSRVVVAIIPNVKNGGDGPHRTRDTVLGKIDSERRLVDVAKEREVLTSPSFTMNSKKEKILDVAQRSQVDTKRKPLCKVYHIVVDDSVAVLLLELHRRSISVSETDSERRPNPPPLST